MAATADPLICFVEVGRGVATHQSSNMVKLKSSAAYSIALSARYASTLVAGRKKSCEIENPVPSAGFFFGLLSKFQLRQDEQRDVVDAFHPLCPGRRKGEPRVSDYPPDPAVVTGASAVTCQSEAEHACTVVVLEVPDVA